MRNCRLLSHVIIVFMILFTVPGVHASDSDIENGNIDLYNQAGKLYQNGQFKEALDMYESILEKGIYHPDLYYNASNAAYRNGSLGRAILYLEKSLKLAPSDPDARANLAFLTSIKKDREQTVDNVVIAFLSGYYDSININSAAVLSGIMFACAMIFASGALFLKSWKRTVIVGIALLCGLFFIVSTGAFIHKLQKMETVTEAIIMSDEANAYSGPGTENTHIFTIHEGTKVVIERHQDSWNLIRLQSGAGGWIQSDKMEKI